MATKQKSGTKNTQGQSGAKLPRPKVKHVYAGRGFGAPVTKRSSARPSG